MEYPESHTCNSQKTPYMNSQGQLNNYFEHFMEKKPEWQQVCET